MPACCSSRTHTSRRPTGIAGNRDLKMTGRGGRDRRQGDRFVDDELRDGHVHAAGYAALRTVPPSGNSYMSPVPGSYVSRDPVGDATRSDRIVDNSFENRSDRPLARELIELAQPFDTSREDQPRFQQLAEDAATAAHVRPK